MRTYLLIALGSVAGLFAMTGAAAKPIDPAISNGPQLAQNTGAADRTLGNSSMGLGGDQTTTRTHRRGSRRRRGPADA